MRYELVRYGPEHKSEAARLLTEFWPNPAANAAYISWIHEENPYTKRPFIYLLIVEGKVAGMRGYHGAKWEVVGSGEAFEALCACMFVIDKTFRGRGFAKEIMSGSLDELAANGYEYVFSCSAAPIPYMSQLRHGWRLAGNYRTVRRERYPGIGRWSRGVARRLPFLRTLWHYSGHQISVPRASAFSSLDALAPTELDGGVLSVTREADATAMAALANDVAIHGQIRHVREPAYFAWRFKNPQMEYRFVYWRDTKLQGFLVLQKGLGSTGKICIVDWEAANAQILERLMGAVLEFGQFASLSVWSAALPDEIGAFMRSYGFAPFDESMGIAGYSPGFHIKSLADNTTDGPWEISGRRIDDLSNWDLRPIYSDQY